MNHGTGTDELLVPIMAMAQALLFASGLDSISCIRPDPGSTEAHEY